MQSHPTAYADINAFLDLLLSQIPLTPGNKLVGLYIFGSLVVGDFDYASSDIDLIAATSTELDEEEVEHLKRMHKEIALQEQMWDDRLEVAYISIEALRRYRPDYRHPFISPGEPFHVTEASANWIINRYVLRKKGIVLFGSPPETLVDPITREELLDALQEFIAEWREWIKHTEVMRPRKYQAYAILTMCRALYTFKQEEIVSKQQAASWAEKELPEWSSLIRRALIWRDDWRNEQVDHDATLPETMRFMDFVLDAMRGYDRWVS
jgi:predicted nucleotidyltransferase